MPTGSRPARCVRDEGFTLLVMLGLLALLGMGLSLAGPAWRDSVQREREAEWLRVGDLYAQALESYVQSAPGSLQVGPARVEELLLDTRFIGVRRHLRQAYGDPLEPMQLWQLLRDKDGRITGVYSSSTAEPFLTQPAPGSRVQLRPQGTGYSRWAFVAQTLPAASSSPIR